MYLSYVRIDGPLAGELFFVAVFGRTPVPIGIDPGGTVIITFSCLQDEYIYKIFCYKGISKLAKNLNFLNGTSPTFLLLLMGSHVSVCEIAPVT